MIRESVCVLPTSIIIIITSTRKEVEVRVSLLLYLVTLLKLAWHRNVLRDLPRREREREKNTKRFLLYYKDLNWYYGSSH